MRSRALEYEVQEGDTLSSIAKKFYGHDDEAHWRKIYEANKETIGDDPDLIKEGDTLTIPHVDDDDDDDEDSKRR